MNISHHSHRARRSARTPLKVAMRMYPLFTTRLSFSGVDYALLAMCAPGVWDAAKRIFPRFHGQTARASALMQGLADDILFCPHSAIFSPPCGDSEERRRRILRIPEKVKNMVSCQNSRNCLNFNFNSFRVDSFHRELGLLLWEEIGMCATKFVARSAQKEKSSPTSNNSARGS